MLSRTTPCLQLVLNTSIQLKQLVWQLCEHALPAKYATAFRSEPYTVAILIVAGQSDLLAMTRYMCDVTKRREHEAETLKLAISAATESKRKRVEDACGMKFDHSLPPVFEQGKRRCTQQEKQELSPSVSFDPFVWTGDEDTPEQIERLTRRLQALMGEDEFPSDLELRDVHTQMLFNVRVEDESHPTAITGEPGPSPLG